MEATAIEEHQFGEEKQEEMPRFYVLIDVRREPLSALSLISSSEENEIILSG